MPVKTSIYKNESLKEYDLSSEQRERYRQISAESRQAKAKAEKGLLKSIHIINTPTFDPTELMSQIRRHKLRALSLFSGGGGLDFGFDRAGYKHVASYELIPICKDTIKLNRPRWKVFGGPQNGDVTKLDWTQYEGHIDVIHGGPPCQPFSIAGEQKGHDDKRNMWGEFNRAVNTIKPKAFVAENVMGLLNPKFNEFVNKYILDELSDYTIAKFEMHAANFGVPQIRRRVFFVGFRSIESFNKFQIPTPTHTWNKFESRTNESNLLLFENDRLDTHGVRSALGLKDIGYDNLSPTIRSAFTGKRNTTSVLNSTAGQKSWGDMQIWPNGVQANREAASNFPSKNQHFRLSVQDVGLIQGFPESWQFAGAVYQILGQIGNSVAPPVAYQVAKNVLAALK